jgi:ligand-binding sensor domain-containing protein
VKADRRFRVLIWGAAWLALSGLAVAASAHPRAQADPSAVAWQVPDQAADLSPDDVTVIAAGSRGVYLGAGKRVFACDADGGKLVLLGALDSQVRALLPEGDAVWVGTDQGLALWDGRAFTRVELGKERPAVTALTQSRGRLLVGTTQGLWEYTWAKHQATPFPAFDGRSITLLDRAGEYVVVVSGTQDVSLLDLDSREETVLR